MKEERMLAEVGSFCMNEACEEFQQIDSGHIHKWGFTEQGKQRYWCEVCQQTFSENKGTLFYRRRIAVEEILECLSLLAQGSTVNAVATAKGYRYETINSWLEEAAEHAEEVTTVLLEHYQVSACEIDGLWTYVQHKGHKKGARKRLRQAPSGVVPCLSATAV